MSLEQQIGALVKASENLTGAVNGKIGEIDTRLAKALTDLEHWKATTSYVQKYSISYAENSTEADRNTGHHNLIKIYTITDAYAAINPWIHLGWTGGNQVGAGHFCSLAQSHAGYTGQQAMFARRGHGELRFFIDRTNQNNAPVYIALKNQSFNNASLRLDMASYMALGVEPKGAVALDTWLADNPNVVEIELLDITTQPVSGVSL
ncbi:hypothetical protein [Photobacterium aquimaris]|uniref:Uncharacterized protein n=1 Tax=Photobacterium aquimaris TaxID=512643 RepID=A0A2T3HT41_9GAMM|nr:hypothetical protein [Photobacterium aquimaris]OBU19605.1 hypothetical protein AYY21_18715 [Photobacterium aquimaris]PQJ41145.1 hypothetical protein BTN98_05745 [Photobacterium aquimaris]PST97926.1 hypothetical protein C0W81_18745 [Photobacterium aquimaris]